MPRASLVPRAHSHSLLGDFGRLTQADRQRLGIDAAMVDDAPPKGDPEAGYPNQRVSLRDTQHHSHLSSRMSQLLCPSTQHIVKKNFEGSHATTEPTINPWDMQQLMGLGINLGNVMDAPTEGSLAKSPTANNFTMFHDAGFGNCRIPVQWGLHMEWDEPYTIEPKFLNRVAELVDASMSNGLVTVITAHHEWWIDFDDSPASKQLDWKERALPRFEALWRQVAMHFRHHRQTLIFGILNEPHALRATSLNELIRRALVAIRESNPSRIVTISGKGFAGPRWLLENPEALFIPRDPQMMLEVHMTDPHGFTGAQPNREAWGSPAELMQVKECVDQLELFGRRRNLPIYVAEFGCSNKWGEAHRGVKWLAANWKEMRRRGFCASIWDDGEKFKIYDRKEGSWDHEVLTALQRSLPGMKGVSIHRHGGGLGGDSSDPTADLQRQLENAFSRLNVAVKDVEQLPELEELELLKPKKKEMCSLGIVQKGSDSESDQSEEEEKSETPSEEEEGLESLDSLSN